MKALVLLSGGVDSTTALYWARQSNVVVGALAFDYGSKHNRSEHYFARRTCACVGLPLSLLRLAFVAEHFESALLQGGGDIPEGYWEAPEMRETVVPFRNGIMLAIAAGYAESKGAEAVVLGNHAGDHAVYPDCRPEFVQSMDVAMRLGTYAGVRLLSPFVDMRKEEIVALGQTLGVDYSNTYSCYNGGIKHCGRCSTCVERKEAFHLSGVPDPTVYEGEDQ